MSYNLFLLLNVNHERESLLDYIGKRLERIAPNAFCLDQSPDIFFSVEYLQEGKDTSLVIDIPFGADQGVLPAVFDFMTYVQDYIQFQVLDPQLGKLLEPNQINQVHEKWRTSNLKALQTYRDGHHFLRGIEVRDGQKIMIEAARFREETWQNHCSVALAYGRIGDAETARHHFERALELDPENPGILYALGVTYFNLRSYEKARNTLMLVLQQDPGNEAAGSLVRDCDAKLTELS